MILTGAALQEVAETALDPEPSPTAFGPTSVDVYPGIDEPHIVESGEHWVVPAREHIDVPKDIAVLISGRSTHMRQGLFMPVGWLDPGFKSTDESPLKLEFGNTSDGASLVEYNEPAARLTFFELADGTNGYQGRYGARGDRR